MPSPSRSLSWETKERVFAFYNPIIELAISCCWLSSPAMTADYQNFVFACNYYQHWRVPGLGRVTWTLNVDPVGAETQLICCCWTAVSANKIPLLVFLSCVSTTIRITLHFLSLFQFPLSSSTNYETSQYPCTTTKPADHQYVCTTGFPITGYSTSCLHWNILLVKYESFLLFN